MGIEDVYDPDETYELTMDNMMKILAIHMRFRYLFLGHFVCFFSICFE